MYDEVGRCPKCGAREINYKPYTEKEPIYTCRRCHCNSCQAQWVEWHDVTADIDKEQVLTLSDDDKNILKKWNVDENLFSLIDEALKKCYFCPPDIGYIVLKTTREQFLQAIIESVAHGSGGIQIPDMEIEFENRKLNKKISKTTKQKLWEILAEIKHLGKW